MSAATIDINVDAGESYGAWTMGDDAALFAEVSSANLACGFHAGDPGTIRRSLAAAMAAGVAIGAHPGLADLPGFGRRGMALSPQEVRDDTLYQVGALAAFVRAAGTTLHHVKPHGALNTAVAETSDAHAAAIVEAVAEFDAMIPVVAVAGSRLHRACVQMGHPVVAEGFPDRAYAADGSLVRRGTPGALIHDPDLAAERAVRMALHRSAVTIDGTEIEVDVGTLCIHGDNPGSVATARTVRAALLQADVAITAF